MATGARVRKPRLVRSVARHSLVAHTGDLRVRIEAPSLPDLFAEAGRALAEIVAGGRPRRASGTFERVELRAPDRDALLVDWLNELIFRTETSSKVYSDLRIEALSDHELVARIRGSAWPGTTSAVKAATFHGLAIASTAAGVEVSVIFDV